MLTNAQMQVGAEHLFVEYRGEAIEPPWRGRITGVRDTHSDPVDKQTRRDRVMTRSQFLIYAEAIGKPADGRTHRTFYHKFVEVTQS